MAGSTYPKGAAKREKILDATLDMIAESGYGAVTIRGVAEQAGLSKTGVAHHFASKDELLTAVLARRDELGLVAARLAAPEALFDTIRQSVAGVRGTPGLTELYVRLAAEATDPRSAAHSFFVERYGRLDALGSAALPALQEAGQAPGSVAPSVLSVILNAVVDGLQLRLLYDQELDIEAALDAIQCLLAAAARAEKGSLTPGAPESSE